MSEHKGMQVEDLEYAPCELCGATENKFLMEIEDWHIVRCTQCGLAYVNPRPRPESILKMYQENAQAHASWTTEYVDFYRQRFQRDVQLFIEYLKKIQHYKTPGRFLDVGCGTGASLYVARQAGWEAYGVELGSWAQEWARVYDLNITTGTLEKASFPDRYFDVVFSKSFLEHVVHPKAVLKEMHRILKDDGLLVCAGIPNLDCFTIKLGVDLFNGNAPPAHLYYFQPATLIQMTNSAGFKCERVVSWGLPNDCFASLFRICSLGRRTDRLTETMSPKRSERSLAAIGYRWTRSAINTVLNWLKIGAVIEVYAKRTEE